MMLPITNVETYSDPSVADGPSILGDGNDGTAIPLSAYWDAHWFIHLDATSLAGSTELLITIRLNVLADDSNDPDRVAPGFEFFELELMLTDVSDPIDPLTGFPEPLAETGMNIYNYEAVEVRYQVQFPHGQSEVSFLINDDILSMLIEHPGSGRCSGGHWPTASLGAVGSTGVGPQDLGDEFLQVWMDSGIYTYADLVAGLGANPVIHLTSGLHSGHPYVVDIQEVRLTSQPEFEIIPLPELTVGLEDLRTRFT